MSDSFREVTTDNVTDNDVNSILEGKRIRTMGGIDLMLMGIGSIIGAGVLVLTGLIAATESGPGVVFSFILAAVVCGFSGLCYAEVSSALPMSGSVYSYTHKLAGRFLGNIIGFIIIAVYLLTTATVASGWSGYFVGLLRDFNIIFPGYLSKTYADGGMVNLPAMLAVFMITIVLSLGTKSSRRINNIMVLIKLTAIALFIIFGCAYIKPANWSPFLPFGIHGVFIGAASVFFAFLGFDAISTAAEDVKNPQKNMPMGIIGALVGSTAVYIIVCLVLTGMLPYYELNVPDAIAFALYRMGQNVVASVISVGAILGILTVIFAFLYATSRIITAMSRDGLLPGFLSRTSEKTKAPMFAIWIFGSLCAVITGLFDIKDLAHLANTGSLVAFIMVSLCTILLRKKYPELNKEGFKVPLYPVLPVLSVLACLFLLFGLPLFTWGYLIVLIVVAVASYFLSCWVSGNERSS